MMDVTTPSILFGSISLLLLAYTNRFTALAKFIRELQENKKDRNPEVIKYQIPILRKRIQFIKQMQIFGVMSFIICTISLFALFLEEQVAGKIFFSISILLLLLSLVFGLWEIIISTKALDLILDDTQIKHNSNQK